MLADARRDLDEAIRLSDGRGRAARQAFAQRGLLCRLGGDLDAARVSRRLLTRARLQDAYCRPTIKKRRRSAQSLRAKSS